MRRRSTTRRAVAPAAGLVAAVEGLVPDPEGAEATGQPLEYPAPRARPHAERPEPRSHLYPTLPRDEPFAVLAPGSSTSMCSTPSRTAPDERGP